MAGKNIYIEKILDNLLSGVDTALNAVKEAMQKMIGGDDPATQKSLPDVVNKLDEVIGEDGKSLSDIVGTGGKSLTDVTNDLIGVIDKLDDVITAISHTAAGIFVVASENVKIALTSFDFHCTPNGRETTKKLMFTSIATGTLYLKVYSHNVSDWSYFNNKSIQLYKNDDATPFVNDTFADSPGQVGGEKTAFYKITVLPGDKIYYSDKISTSLSKSLPYYLDASFNICFDNGMPTEPGDIIVVG